MCLYILLYVWGRSKRSCRHHWSLTFKVLTRSAKGAAHMLVHEQARVIFPRHTLPAGNI